MLKLGGQRKIPSVNITNVCANASDHQKLSLVRKEIATIMLHLYVWEL